jgi:transposase
MFCEESQLKKEHLNKAKFELHSTNPQSFEEKFSQKHFFFPFAAIAPELSKENSNTKPRVDKKQLIVHMNNSMCHNGRKIQEYFARKEMTRAPHPVYSPDLSPCDFSLFGYAKKRMKDQIITYESDLEDKLTEVWQNMSGYLLRSVFYELMGRLEWIMEHG